MRDWYEIEGDQGGGTHGLYGRATTALSTGTTRVDSWSALARRSIYAAIAEIAGKRGGRGGGRSGSVSLRDWSETLGRRSGNATLAPRDKGQMKGKSGG